MIIPSATFSTELNQLDHLVELSLLSKVLLRLPKADVALDLEAKAAVRESFESIRSTISEFHGLLIDGFSPRDDDLLLHCLDKGLRVAYLKCSLELSIADTSAEKTPELDTYAQVLSSFPRSRMGVSVDIESAVSTENSIIKVVERFNTLAEHFLFRFTSKVGSLEGLASLIRNISKAMHSVSRNVQIYFEFDDELSEDDTAALASGHEGIHVVVAPRSSNKPAIDYVGAYIKCLKTDRSDRLYSSVVCDEQGVCLGLVYSNEESFRTAVRERRGVYWSRSRNSLWKKGDTSGMYQELHAIDYDCDGDALRFIVRQRGEPASFCHLLTKTCWGEARGIQKLEEMLVDRKKAAPPGSYTKRLFDDPKLLQSKLLEEVQELVEATEPDHIAAEAADVIYFLMTRCVAAGVTLTQIENHLEKRSYKVTRRPGNAKEWRDKQAQEILQQQASTSADAK